MTGEEMERAIQPILQQQAQFWASIQSLEQIVQNHTTQIGEPTHDISERSRAMPVISPVRAVTSRARSATSPAKCVGSLLR